MSTTAIILLLFVSVQHAHTFYCGSRMIESSRITKRFEQISHAGKESLLCMSSEKVSVNSDIDNIFGSEFNQKPIITAEEIEIRQQAMKGFDNVRSTFLADGLFVGAIGLSVTLAVGTFNDALSYGIGAVLGIGYSLLLGKYVERLGTSQSGGGGNSRFLPAIVLIALYGKYRDTISIIPELLGFFSTYKIATLLQIFNRNLYGDEIASVEEIEAERKRLM